MEVGVAVMVVMVVVVVVVVAVSSMGVTRLLGDIELAALNSGTNRARIRGTNSTCVRANCEV